MKTISALQNEWDHSYVSISRAIYTLIGVLLTSDQTTASHSQISISKTLEAYLKQLCCSPWILSSLSDTFSEMSSFHQELHNENKEFNSTFEDETFTFLMMQLKRVTQKISAYLDKCFGNHDLPIQTVIIYVNIF